MPVRRALLVGVALSLVAADEGVPWVSTDKDDVVVWGDLFARWDDTRWRIDTEIQLPYAVGFEQVFNGVFYTAGYQVRAVLACSKTWKLTRKSYEVDCVLEDVAIQASIADGYNPRRIATAQEILDEIDGRLQGAELQLQVAADGRVTNIDIEGLREDNERERSIAETFRQVLSRVVVGFDMKMQPMNQLHEGKWIEYHSRLMSMPVRANSTGTRSSSTLVHYLNRYDGHVLVQSIGEGIIELPPIPLSAPIVAPMTEWTDGQRPLPELVYLYDTDFVGVSLYDPTEGFMTERVWALEAKATASAQFNVGQYWHAGRITRLGDLERPDVGPTRVVGLRGKSVEGVPDWVGVDAALAAASP